MTVRPMTQGDLALVLDWAASEGWNPGIEDAAAFFSADPTGFFLKEVGSRPMAAISVVNHSDEFAFLGLYICHPDFRSQGYGMEVWRAGMPYAGNRCVGLDGVPDQQSNYARSGFTHFGKTVRYRGALESGGPGGPAPADRSLLAAADAAATGVSRSRFSASWFAETDTRRTICLPDTDPAEAFATFRQCREGVKVGPLYADNKAQIDALLASAPTALGDGPLFIDAPDESPALSELLLARGFEPVFETARMYLGEPPAARPPPYYAVATLELG